MLGPKYSDNLDNLVGSNCNGTRAELLDMHRLTESVALERVGAKRGSVFLLG